MTLTACSSLSHLDTVHPKSPLLGDRSLLVEVGQSQCLLHLLSIHTAPHLGEACLQSVSPTIEHLFLVTVVLGSAAFHPAGASSADASAPCLSFVAVCTRWWSIPTSLPSLCILAANDANVCPFSLSLSRALDLPGPHLDLWLAEVLC